MGERKEQGGGGALDNYAAQGDFPQGGREAGSALAANGELRRGCAIPCRSAAVDGRNQGNGFPVRPFGREA